MYEPVCTYLIIGLTCLFSFFGFRSRAVEEKYIFDPRSILADKEYYRLVSSAFLHSGWIHLLVNMISLNAFGRAVEFYFGRSQFLFIYFGAVVGGNLLSLWLHRHHEYRAYGASGGVCGIIFTTILIDPAASLTVFPVPYAVPGWLFAIIFLVGSFFAMKGGNLGNIGHDAHLGGAIVGFLAAGALHPDLVRVHLWVFLLLLAVAASMLTYVWLNPMFLPIGSFLGTRSKRGRPVKRTPTQRREAMEIDAILDKIAKAGIDSLTAEERALLGEVSDKYRRREQSEKPGSGLAI
jgi:membrane associated rhomboid family serine protease